MNSETPPLDQQRIEGLQDDLKRAKILVKRLSFALSVHHSDQINCEECNEFITEADEFLGYD